jgi:hypothetical protein
MGEENPHVNIDRDIFRGQKMGGKECLKVNSGNKYLYILVGIMLLVAKEDIDGLRVRDRIEFPADREWII